jgi:hypothetical protein
MPVNYQKTYDTLSYEEGIEFRDLVMELIAEIYPYYRVTPFEAQNPDVIYITNQEDNIRIHFPLRDLYTRFSQTARTRTDLKDKILSDYADAFKMLDEDIETLHNSNVPEWTEARDSVEPRLMRIEEFSEDIEEYVFVPFGEGIINCLIIYDEEDRRLTRIRKTTLEKWNITIEELFERAMENFAVKMEGLELVGTAKPRGILWNETGRDYTATAILLGDVRYLIGQTIGTPFRFGVPSSFAFYSWAELDNEDFQIEMKAMIKREYDRQPKRLSTNIYEVNENGDVKQIKNQPEITAPPTISNN